jgi:hypothetical protein
MDSVTNFDDLPMHSVAEVDDDSVMEVTPRESSPLPRGLLSVSLRPDCGPLPSRAFLVLRGGGVI